jgi:alkyl hydroperoxide reductase subunit AhpC
MTVQIGAPAPAFKADAYDRTKDAFVEITIEDYAGKWLLLYFYPMDFTAAAAADVAGFDRAVDQFGKHDCQLLACSTDSPYAHKGWCDAQIELNGLQHPLLADLTKRIAMDYGVLVPEQGVALPSSFLIDPQSAVRWSSINDPAIARNVSEVLRILELLRQSSSK